MKKTSKGSRFVYAGLIGIFLLGGIHYLWVKIAAPKPTNQTTRTHQLQLLTRFCTVPAPVSVNATAGINNPLGIKLTPFVKMLGGTYSGLAATDGGTFAKFATPEAAFAAGKATFRRANEYLEDTTVDQALRIYSNNGYGGEILVGTGINPEDGIRSINDEEMDAVLKAIAKQESSHPLASAVLVVNANKNDHHLENVEQFDINLSDFFDAKGSCFGGYVRRPNFWNTWTKEFITDIPDQEVWFWFFGRPNPEGPFHEWNMPQFFYPPMISLRDPYEEFRMRGTKGAVIRYTRTS